MTVKELIELLKDFPDDAEVFTYDHEWGYFPTAVPVMEESITIEYSFTDRPSDHFNNVVVL